MKFADRLAAADRLQRSTRFKVIASIAVAALVFGAFIALFVAANEAGAGERIAQRAAERARASASGVVINEGPITALGRVIDSALLTIKPIQAAADEGQEEAASGPSETGTSSSGAALVGFSLLIILAVLQAIIWLGLGLTYLALFLIGWGLAWPLMLWPVTSGVGQLALAATPLVLAFLTGIELLRFVLSGPTPLLAVGRNLLQEAVRMKISLVFIVLLILLLSYTPGALNEAQPLRYRIQQWMQYGMGLSYVVLALLTLFLSVGTVSFEQRDRIIWQTMVKPVAPWQYLLGKWVGVMGLNAVLLVVTACGVYLFTEYLRHQPAQGEIAYQVREDGYSTLGRVDEMTEDRRLLETQVLVARKSAEPSELLGPERIRRAVDARIAQMQEQDSTLEVTSAVRERVRDELLQARLELIEEAIEERVQDAKSREPETRDTPELRRQYGREILAAQEARYRTIPSGASQAYFFSDLPAPDPSAAPTKHTLRFLIRSGSNNPAALYRVGFRIGGQRFERQVALGAAQTMLFDSGLIDQDGTLVVEVYSHPDNDREITFPSGGLELLYVAGGYELNFLRIMVVMWMKLGFIAAVSIAAATFVSFPVACLIAMTVVFSAESAGFLWQSLEYYTSKTKEGIDYMAVAVRVIAVPIALAFKSFSELKPTETLVDGRLVSWGSLFSSIATLGGWVIGILAAGWAVFRKRELATYSGRS